MKNKLFSASILILSLYLIVTSFASIYNWSGKGKQVSIAQESLDKAKQENEQLKRQLEYVKTNDFVEKEARDKLGLSKSGETTVILPENVEQIMGAMKEDITPTPTPILANWEKWGRALGLIKR